MGLKTAPVLADSVSDLAGGFDLGGLSRPALGALGREWLLHGHLHDRAGMPLYLSRSSRHEMERLAIDEWMAASPVYSRRMQRALRFEGDGVSTLFKNMQLDIGAPHQFLDFRFRVLDEENGEFWLDHCGALMDVEPLGEDFVRGMCHHIEDPTFDATAAATNPHAEVRPVHRPPRAPADRHPHCQWTVTIDPAFPPCPPHPAVALMRSSPLGSLDVQPPGPPAPDGGVADYSGPFDPDFELEDLSRPALLVTLDELALQAHLLSRSFVLALSDRTGVATAADLGARALVGVCGVSAERIRAAADLPLDSAGSVATLLELHPALRPRRLLGARVELDGTGIRVGVRPSPAVGDAFSVLSQLDRHGAALLESVARAVDPRALCRPVAAGPGEWLAFEIVTGGYSEPPVEPMEVALVRLSTGAGFEFRPAPARLNAQGSKR